MRIEIWHNLFLNIYSNNIIFNKYYNLYYFSKQFKLSILWLLKNQSNFLRQEENVFISLGTLDFPLDLRTTAHKIRLLKATSCL